MPEPIDLDSQRHKSSGAAPGGKPGSAEGSPRPPRAATTPKPPPKNTRPKLGERDAHGEKVRSPADRKLITEVEGLYQAMGVGLIGVGMTKEDNGLASTGAAVCEAAGAAATAWVDLADQNPAVKRALARLTEASVVGSLVAVHVAMAMPLLVDRGVIPKPAAAMAAGMFAASNSNGNGNTA